jgi:predicted MFS family arabinose efflux permease
MAISSLGAFVDWRTASALAALPSVITVILLYFLHESPTWYVRRNRIVEAERALQWLWRKKKKKQVNVCGYKDGVKNYK